MKRKGFYLVGVFSKGYKASFMILPQTQKPFEFDPVEGKVSGKPMTTMGKRRYVFPTNWEFIEYAKISDIDTNQTVRDYINDTWEDWCREHRRKYIPLLGKLKQHEQNK